MGPGQTSHKFQAWAPPELAPKYGPNQGCQDWALCSQTTWKGSSSLQPVSSLKLPAAEPVSPIQLRCLRVPALESDKEVENWWWPRRSYTLGGAGSPWSQNLLVVNPSELDREKETDFGWWGWGAVVEGVDSVVYGCLVLENQNEPVKLWLLEITRRITLVEPDTSSASLYFLYFFKSQIFYADSIRNYIDRFMCSDPVCILNSEGQHLLSTYSWQDYCKCNSLGGGYHYYCCVHFIDEKNETQELTTVEFPSRPEVKTPHHQCRGREFDPWSEK